MAQDKWRQRCAGNQFRRRKEENEWRTRILVSRPRFCSVLSQRISLWSCLFKSLYISSCHPLTLYSSVFYNSSLIIPSVTCDEFTPEWSSFIPLFFPSFYVYVSNSLSLSGSDFESGYQVREVEERKDDYRKERDKFVRKELQSDRVSITRKIIGHVLVVCFKWHHRRKSEWREGKKRSARRRSWLRYWKRMRIRDSKNKSSSGSRTWRRQEQTSHSINASSLFLVLFRTSVSCHFYIFLLFNEQVKKSIRNLRRVWSITFTSSLS